MERKLDFLAIGDITTDAFIRLKDASVNCKVDTGACELCFRFADKIPYEFVEVVRAVGNSANAAVSASRLGLASGLITNMGDDQNGKECLETLQKEKVNTAYVSEHAGKETNYHYVLWFEADRTILVKHHHYDYKLPNPSPAPRWVYFSSMGTGTEEYHDAVAEYLETRAETRFAFQPGTFQMKLGAKRLERLYRRSDLFFCNVEEARKITSTEGDPKSLLAEMHKLGPRMVVVTDGPKGAYFSDGRDSYFMPIYPDPKPPYERTGAGDAFASTFTAGVAQGLAPLEALRWAPVNSMAVVQEIGAQRGLLDRAGLEELLAQAPKDYQPQKI